MRSVRSLASVLILIPVLVQAAETPAGRWEGAIQLPSGALQVVVNLEPEGGSWKGTMDIPAQGALGLRLSPLTIDGTAVRFTLVGVPGEPTFEGTLAGGEIRGNLAQGSPFPFHLRREGEGDPASGAAGRWAGAVEVPGMSLPVTIVLEKTAEGWKGTADIQGKTGLPLDEISVDGAVVRFVMVGPPGKPVFDGRLEGGEIRGTFLQRPSFPVTLTRKGDAARLARPQEPKPPFPYSAEEVAYTNGGVKLAGTLTLPPGAGPFPAVLLISGSGAQNRDEELLGHRPFAVIADHLTRAGLAVLRVDDRGVGGSTGDVASSTTEDFAGDALAGVRFLTSHPQIDPRRVGLLGHSEGAVVAPLAASRSKDVAFVVMLAGSAVPGYDLLRRQGELLARASGLPEDQVASYLEIQKKALDLIRDEKDEAVFQAKLKELARLQAERLSEEEKKALGSDPQAAIELVLKQQSTPWWRAFVAYDPRTALRKVKVPVLAVNGTLDLQVDADQNLPEIEKALKEAGNPDVTVRRFPGLNHLFQTAKTGTVDEYGQIEETVSPAVLDAVTRWIVERFAAKP